MNKLLDKSLAYKVFYTHMDEKDVARYWDSNSPTWISVVRRGADRFRVNFHDPEFFDLLGPVRDLTVLDAGCGEGVTCRKLAEMGANVTGIDISEQMIAAARSVSGGNKPKIQYQVDSFTKLSTQPRGTYDRIVSVMALMDSPGLDAAFNSFRRVLRPNGELVFSISHPMTDRPGISWRETKVGADEVVCITNYFDNTPWEDVWSFSADDHQLPPLHIPTFPRTISTYLNALCQAEFRIIESREPRPTVEAMRTYPVLKRWSIAPFYMMVRAQAV